MKINKKSFTVFLCTMFCVSLFAKEQSVVRKSSTTENKKTETSVEQEYLSDVDGVVILSLAASDEYDNKLVAMQFLESAVENGNTYSEINLLTDDERVNEIARIMSGSVITDNAKNAALEMINMAKQF